MKLWTSLIIGNSIIWAGVIIAAAIVLKGSGYFSDLIPILAAGAAGSLIVNGGVKSKLES